MTRLERIRLTKKEQKTAQWIGTPLVLFIKVLIKVLWKIKRWLMIVFLAGFLVYGVSSISAHADSPRADLTQPIAITPTPTSQFLEIKAYITQVFGKDAPDAFKILACENHSLNPNATGHNSNGTYDRGIFQINDVHDVNPEYLYDYKININIAYHIFKTQGWNPWACESVWHALERNDTI